MLELTRAANLIADCVRETFMRKYRLAEGRFVVEYGPTEALVYRQLVVQYTHVERDRNPPYPTFTAVWALKLGL
jgi:hypothetical protein